MINFHQRSITKSFDTIKNLGYKDLVVGGCSFTYNFSDTCALSWPYYIRDLLGFDQVYDSSLPGAGNYHIAQSIKWLIEVQNFDPNTTFVAIMWSGTNRDDIIANSSFVDKNRSVGVEYKYQPSVSNVIRDEELKVFKDLSAMKSCESRAVENYLLISGMWHYLKSKGFSFIFLDFIDPNLPNRTGHFDIIKYLPAHLQKKYKSMFSNVPTIYEWSIRHNLLNEDDFHPSPNGHLKWCREVLVPHLMQLNIQ